MASYNSSLQKNPMPMQDPVLRARNFDEVTLGYDEQTALAEAARCLGCRNMPCVSGCPVNIAIPEFIAKVKKGDFESSSINEVRCNSLSRSMDNS